MVLVNHNITACEQNVERVAEGLGKLAQIDLADLPAESELMTRTDRKYALSLNQAHTVVSLLNQHSVVTVEDRVFSRYESVYYDTPQFQSYFDAAGSRRHRFKVRARTYLDSNTTLLEVKTKDGRGRTIKERIPVHQEAREHLTSELRGYVAETLSTRGVLETSRIVENLVPTLKTTYQRATLLAPDGSRSTLDIQLECEHKENRARYQDLVLLETKSLTSATELDRSLWRAGIRPVSVSKYATGLAALVPDLPHNKWHQTAQKQAMKPIIY